MLLIWLSMAVPLHVTLKVKTKHGRAANVRCVRPLQCVSGCGSHQGNRISLHSHEHVSGRTGQNNQERLSYTDPSLETVTKLMKIYDFIRGPYGIAGVAFGGSLALIISGAIVQGLPCKGRILIRMLQTPPTPSLRMSREPYSGWKLTGKADEAHCK